MAMQTIELVKGGHRFILRYEEGSEVDALAAVTAWAQNPSLWFDWFDSAIMAKEIGMRTSKEKK